MPVLENTTRLSILIFQEKSRDATRVLIVIVVVFLLCNALGFVVTLLESLYTQRGLLNMCPGFYAFAREAVNFLAIVNSSINFVIYCVFGQDFRRELICVWGCKKFTFMMPVGDKFTAEGLMLNSNFHRRPSMFVRYVGLIRQSSAAQLYENGHKIRRSTGRNDDVGGKMPGLANVKGILASLHPQSNNYAGMITPDATSSQRKVIITSTEYTDDEEEGCGNELHKVPEAHDSWDERTRKHDGARIANGSSVGVHLLAPPRPLSKSKASGSRSNHALSSWRERLPSSSKKRRRCSSALSSPEPGRLKSSSSMQKELSKSTASCSESEPLAPFLLGMLISTAPTVRQAGFETAIKNYENAASEEMAWV